jgi:hypothetical protein
MQIELRKLKIALHLSEETTAYSAEIWIDGQLAFHASNQGHGGPDLYRQIGRWSEKDVDAWLIANRPPQHVGSLEIPHDLGIEVGALIAEADALAQVKRRLRTNVLTIEAKGVMAYPLRKRPREIVERAVRATNPATEIVTGNDAGQLLRAARIISSAASNSAES